jgi:hypothetical protein
VAIDERLPLDSGTASREQRHRRWSASAFIVLSSSA